MQVDDLPPHSTYYNYTFEQGNHQTSNDVLDWVLTMTARLNYDTETLRNLKALYKYTVRERERERETYTNRQIHRQIMLICKNSESYTMNIIILGDP